MTDLEKKVVAAASKHPEFDKSVVLTELKYLNDADPDLIANLWTLHVSSQERGEIRTENKWDSHLAYFLKITLCKPSQDFHIEKRRTYGRSGFPDIDMDFDYLRRSEVVDYLVEKYGREYVGNIGNVQTLKTKAAVRRAIKVLDPTNSVHFDHDGKVIKSKVNENFALENEILQTLPKLMKRGDGSFVNSVDEASEEYPQFGKYMQKYPEVRRIASELEGTVAGFGCLSNDTVVKTEYGNCRIDQIDGTILIAYIDINGELQHTSNYFAHKTGHKKCYKLKLQNGSWIKVTDEHLVFTDKGCINFKEIRENPQDYKVWSLKE